MAKKKIEENVVVENTSLTASLVDLLNKEFKDVGKIAHVLNDPTNPVHVTEFVSTGSTALDLAISNRKYGGCPVGKITELGGLKQSSKSLVAAHLLAETQKKGGIAILFDTESAASTTFMEAIGVNTAELVHIRLTTVEDIFAAIDKLATKVRATGSKQLITIVIDSMAAATTKREDAAEFEQMGWNTSKAILLSQSMRKITEFISVNRICLVITNQLRVNLAQTIGDNYVSSGGLAIPYHSTVQIRLKNKGKITVTIGGEKETVGAMIEALVFKNRLGPPFRIATFNIYFDRGIDDLTSWIDILVSEDLVKKDKLSYLWDNPETGEQLKFTAQKLTEMLKTDKELRETMYNQICEAKILQYKSSQFTEDEIEMIIKDEIDKEELDASF